MIDISRSDYGSVQRSDASGGEHLGRLGGRAPGYTVQAGMTRKTVKELIMMKRQAMQQSQQELFQQKICNPPPQKKPLRARRPDFEVPAMSPAVHHQQLAANQSTPTPAALSSAPPTPPTAAAAGASNLFPLPGPINDHVLLPQQLQHVPCSAPSADSLSPPLAVDLSRKGAQWCSAASTGSALSPVAVDLSTQHALQCCSASSTSALSPPPLADCLPHHHNVQYSSAALASALVSSFIDGQSRQHAQWSALAGAAPPQQAPPALADDGKMTFFQWQILQEVQRLEGMDPEVLMAQDDDGDTFLHIAVAQGKRALAHVLASNMAAAGFLDVKENKGQTALQLAAATNQHLIVQDLLFHGAQVDTVDRWGRSPLHVCAEKGHLLSLQIIHRVLDGSWPPTDVEQVNYDGLTPLHAAVLCHNAAIKELRCLPASAPESRRAEELRLRSRMYGGCVRTLLLMGACCGTPDLKSGRTSLHMASEEANVDLLHVFLDQPSSLSVVNMKMYNGNTALHIASSLQNRGSQVEAVRLLLRRGADPSTRNNENELPAQLVPAGPVGDKLRQILKGRAVRS